MSLAPETHTTLDDVTGQPAPSVEANDPLPGRIVGPGGKIFWPDMKGRLIPDESVSAVDKLMDEMVRKVVGHALPLEAQVKRFKNHTLADIYGHVALLDQEYGVKRGGVKGNMTFITHDGCMMLKLAVAEQIQFGPELQSAKSLVDECLMEWSAESVAPLRTIVASAFNVDQQGRISPHALFALLRHDIDDPRWQRAMDAIRDSIRPVGSKEYVRVYVRSTPRDEWRAVVIDLGRV